MGDFVSVKLAQRADAKNQFGTFKSSKRGQGNVDVPDVDGLFAQRVRAHWRNEAKRTREHVLDIPDSAIVSQWTRAVARLNNRVVLPTPFGLPVEIDQLDPLNDAIDRRAAIGKGALLTSTDAEAFWDLIDAVVNPMRGINDTPTSWEIFVEAVEESARDAFKFSTDFVVAAAIIVVGAWVVTR